MKKANAAETEPADQHLNPVSDAVAEAESVKARREIKQDKLENIDIDAIDKIVLASDLKQGGTIRVERRGPLDQDYSYLIKIAVEDWNTSDRLEWLKKMFGGGDYQCRTFRANGQMYRMFKFSIDPRFRGQLDEDEIRRMGGSEGKNGAEGSIATKLLDMVRNQPAKSDSMPITDIMALIEKASGRSEQSNTMLMTIMMKSMESQNSNMVAMMTAMMTAFAGMNKGGSDSSTVLMPLLLKLLERKESPMNETLEIMAKIKDIFGNDKEPTDDKDDMLARLGRIAGPVLKGVFGGQQPQQPAPQVEAPPNVTALPAAPQQPQPGEVKFTRMASMMPEQYKLLIQMGLSAAERNSDPSLYADIIYDQLDPEGLETLREILTPDDWCAKLFADESQIAHIRPWLDNLRQLILHDEPESNTTGGPAGASSPVPSQ